MGMRLGLQILIVYFQRNGQKARSLSILKALIENSYRYFLMLKFEFKKYITNQSQKN